MEWLRQKRKVDRLSQTARKQALDTAVKQDKLKGRAARELGTAEGIAWSFAAGTLSGAARNKPIVPASGRPRKIISLLNASWFGWQLVSQILETESGSDK